MATSRNIISVYLYIFLINLSFICCIIEIPLQAIKVKGIPKYQNLTIIEPASPLIEKNGTFYYQEGNVEINSEFIFFASIKIGSNSQPFNLLLDTGSSVLWVTHSNCGKKCSDSITRHYNPDSSTTKEGPYNSFSIQYGTGSVSGNYYKDNMVYLSNKVFSMYFGVASSCYFPVTNCDGIIGLTKSYQEKRLSIIQMLKDNGNTDSTAFSIKFENDNFQGGIKGTMFIGVHEDFSKNETVSCPLTYYLRNDFWAGELSSFGLKNNQREAKSNYKTKIIFDTGTNAIILPTQYLIDIQNDLSSFNCAIVQGQNAYQIACIVNDNLPDLKFKINGHTLIFPRNYAFYYNSQSTQYAYSFVSFEDSSPFIMGSPFFFLFHTLFDEENKVLKFYPLHSAATDGGSSGNDDTIDDDTNNNDKNNNNINNVNNIKLTTLEIVLIIITCVSTLITISLVVYIIINKRKEKNNIDDNLIRENIEQNISEGLFKPEAN